MLVELQQWVGRLSREQHLPASQLTFTRRDAREALRWTTTHLRNHLERLVEAEYVLPLGRGRGKLYRYSLLYDGEPDDGTQHSLGIVDAACLVEPKS